MVQRVPAVEERKERAGGSPPFLEDQPDVGAVAKEVPCTGGAGRDHLTRSDGQLVPSLGPTARQHASAAFRAHPFEKPVRPFSRQIRGLPHRGGHMRPPFSICSLQQSLIILSHPTECQCDYSPPSGAPPERARSSILIFSGLNFEAADVKGPSTELRAGPSTAWARFLMMRSTARKGLPG